MSKPEEKLYLSDDEIDLCIKEAKTSMAEPVARHWDVKRIAATLDDMRRALIRLQGGVRKPDEVGTWRK